MVAWQKWHLTGLTGINGRFDLVDRLKPQFPQLDVSSAEVTSPQTTAYNCIAYAAGDTTKWWWPDLYGFSYWPPNTLRLISLPAFQQAFSSLGYQVCANGTHQVGQEKIAIYHLATVPTHAARQLSTGIWTSKMGPWHDIIHTEQCLSGSQEYGDIAFFMSRSVPT